MYKVNALSRQLWIQKTVAPCQCKKANVNKPDTVKTFRKMSCYFTPYIICHMTPQLNLLLQKKKKKKYVKLLVTMRFGQRQNNTTERSPGRYQLSLLSFWGGNDFLQLADGELALTLPGARTWNEEDLEHTQMRTKMQPQVIINGNRKLEKTVTSYTNTTVMPSVFVCPAGLLCSSFHNDPVFSFTLSHIINRHVKCKSPDSDPIPAKCKDDYHTEFHNNLHNDSYSQPLSSVHTKDCNLNFALNRFSFVGAGYQANCRFKIYRTLGRVSSGVGMDTAPSTYLLLAAKKNNFVTKRLVSFQSSPNKWNWQNETWETLATEESSLPRIKVNNWFVSFCFISLKGIVEFVRSPKHSHTLLTASAYPELQIHLLSLFNNND